MMKGRVLLSMLSYACAVKVAKNSHQNVLASFSEKVFDPASEDLDVGDVMQKMTDHVDLASALRTVQHKDLPPSVSHLVQSTSEGKSGGFDEESLEKARAALNLLVEKAWIELDEKIVRCKGFQEMSHENFAQINRDYARLHAQITDMERVEIASVDGIASTDKEISETEGILSKEDGLYQAEKQTNDAELTVHKNDLEVFQFILEFTKCSAAGTSFVQTTYQVCQMASGRRTLLFKDQQMAKRFKTMLQPSSRQRLDSLLALVHAPHPPSFFQVSAPALGEDGLPCGASGMDECLIQESCSPDVPDCGLLHDKLSLMWGEYKDNVDGLTMTMASNDDKWKELKDGLNGQIDLLSDKKSKLNMLLAEARSNLASDRQEKKEKETEKKRLGLQYVAYMKQCKKRIEWIVYQDMCAIVVVRNALMTTSTKCAPSQIVDCKVSKWVREECDVSCDDSCNPSEPFKCGGWQKIKRDVVTDNNHCGIECPQTSMSIRCGQYPCPVDCVMSDWSGWSACSAECEGGVEGRTRSVLTKPKNGGEQCNTPEESQACNTVSCDRNCKLTRRWTRWSPCSARCGGGVQEQRKHVVIPIRGDGKCPTANSHERYRKRQCNRHRCRGDEVCTANQDLVVAIDGSGSLQQTGFDILKEFAETLVSRYQTKYFGREQVKIGICQFGNGEVMADGKTISRAINVQALTSDRSAVLESVKNLPFKKGFTNMAQAYATAEDMFTQNSRPSTQQAVLIITDGKPSFAFETQGLVEQLDDKGIMRYFVAVNDQLDDEGHPKLDDQIKSWASQPWSAYVVHVPGLKQLDGDIQTWAQKAVTKFCPPVLSPSSEEWRQRRENVQKVYEGGECNGVKWFDQGRLKGSRWRTMKKCRDKAKSDGRSVFQLARKRDTWRDGRRWRSGYECLTGDMDVPTTLYDQWFNNKAEPECSAGWHTDDKYDMYALDNKDTEGACAKMGIKVPRWSSDCTNNKVWHWQGGSGNRFSSSEWKSETYDQWGGADTCVAFVRTGRRTTCKEWCASFGRTCHRGQDDARRQAGGLNYWLTGQGKAGTRCTAYDGDHSQSTDENGCLQKLWTQMCACK